MISRTMALAATALACGPALAQDQNAPLITASPGFGSYDPQLTAKEAVLANWDLAVSGIRAGGYLGGRIADAAEAGRVNAAALGRQAGAAVDTMIVRYNSAHWLISQEPSLTPVDAGHLTAVIEASEARCASDCGAHLDQVGTAFRTAADAFDETALDALALADVRAEQAELRLLSELLITMADYLEGGAWSDDLMLVEHGRGDEELSARLVGLLAIWGNIEPYIGMRSPEIDDAINAGKDALLRDLRDVRRQDALDADGPEIQALSASASDLAIELRRAAELFVS